MDDAQRERAGQALNLKLAGIDWETIADKLGYDDPVDAIEDVTEIAGALYDGDPIDPARVLEVLRLDRLYAIAWRKALQGDMFAAKLALDIGDRRQRLMRMNQRSRD